MKNILDYSLEELSSWFEQNNEKKFRAKQVFSWIYKGIYNFSEMKNIPNSLSDKLNNNFTVDIPKIEKQYISSIDGTRKFLYEFKDGNIIECVVMKYKHGNSICISTQVGCLMGCKFCASTIDGKVRDLTSGEMLSQVILAQDTIKERISNIVLMGSGEPFDNYDNVIKFIEIVNAEYGLNIGQRHITVSTCGIVPKIYETSDKNLSITLAISLHAYSDEKRKQIMPIASKYSIAEIIEGCKYYINKTNRRITFEYALVKGVNDSTNDADKLGQLLNGLLCHVNLIPVNQVRENNFERTTSKDIEDFKRTLEKHRIEVTIRREMGSDINAACGQLRRSYIKENNLTQN